MSLMGHSRPMHSVPVPINVRCYSSSDIFIRRRKVTLRATSVSRQSLFNHLVGGCEQRGRHVEAERLGGS